MKEHHDRVRAITNYNFSLVLLVGFTLALIPAFVSERADILSIPVFSGFIFSILLLFANKFIYSSKVMGFFFIVLGLTIVLSNLYLNTEVLHIGAPIWMLIVILYSFYNVGILWSIIVSILCFSSYVFWIVYFLDDEVQRVQQQVQETVPLLVLEVGIAFTLVVAMAIVYIRAIFSKERQLTLKNKQMLMKQKASEEESMNYAKQVRRSTNNIHKYFDTIYQLTEENDDSKFLKKQLLFSSIVYKVFALQGRYKDNDPGVLITSVLSNALATFENKNIKYTVDNTIDFIEEQHVFPLCIVLTMLVCETSSCENAQNIAVSYFYENGEVILRYQDDCENKQNGSQEDQIRISNIILSDVGAKYVSKKNKSRAFVELRFPL